MYLVGLILFYELDNVGMIKKLPFRSKQHTKNHPDP